MKSEETNFSKKASEKFENHDHGCRDCLLLECWDCANVASNNFDTFRNLIFSNDIYDCICHILCHPNTSCPFNRDQSNYTIKNWFFFSLKIFRQNRLSSLVVVNPHLRLVKQYRRNKSSRIRSSWNFKQKLASLSICEELDFWSRS